MLIDIINLKLNRLYTELEKINKDNDIDDVDSLEKVSILCEDFLSSMSDNRSNIVNLDIDTITDILIKYGNNPYDKEEVSNKFRHIRLVYKGIASGIDIRISDSQEAFLESYITNVMQVIKNIHDTINDKLDRMEENEKESNRINDMIIELEILLDKIKDVNNNDILDENDFNTIYGITNDEDISTDMKMGALIEFRKYNQGRLNHETKHKNSVNIEDVRNCFIEHGLKEKQLIIMDKFKKEVENNANIDNIRSILNYMESKNILHEFAFSDLLTICLYGTLDSVKNRYELLESKDRLYSIFFNTASIWINNTSRRTNRKGIMRSKRVNKQNRVKALAYTAHSVSFDDLIQNEKFLREKGYDVSLERGDVGTKALRIPHEKLVSNFETISSYGMFEKGSSLPISAISNVARLEDKLDYFVECGLLGDSDNVGEEMGNYLCNHPATMNHVSNRLYPVLYKMKRDMDSREYYDMLFSPSRRGCLKKEFTAYMFGLDLNNDEVFNKYMSDNFADYTSLIPNYDAYFDVITSDIPVDTSVVSELDKRFKVDGKPLIYRIGNRVISRNKVIRNYGKLLSSGIDLGDDALFFSIVNGSYLNEKELKAISSDIGYSLEGDMKL